MNNLNKKFSGILNYDHFEKKINELVWEDFENLVINLFKEIYLESEISIRQTQASKDGGKDGEGLFIIEPDKEHNDLSIEIIIWIEVKKRSKNVVGNDIGWYAIKALNKRVSKIIFATNKFFTKDAKDELKRLSSSYFFNYALIDGHRLFTLIKKYNREENNVKQMTTNCKLGFASLPSIKTNISFSKKVFKDFYTSDNLTIETDIPFFIFIDFEFDEDIDEYVIPQYDLFIDEVELVKYCSNNLVFPLMPTEGNVHIWLGKSNEKIINPFIKIKNSKKSSVFIELPTNLIIEKPLFQFEPSLSNQDIINKINNLLECWFLDFKYKSLIIYGNAGTGKSFITNRLRYLWLKNQMIEICLDGEVENSESKLLERIFKEFFPVKCSLFTPENKQQIYNMLIDYGLPDISADKLSNEICMKSQIDTKEFNSEILNDLLFFLLTKITQRGPLVIVYEDLHKCQPSVISIILKLHKLINYQSVNKIFLLLSSRKSVNFKEKGLNQEWILNLEKLLDETKIIRFDIEPYTKLEARDILIKTIPTLPLHFIEVLIRQIGTTPFGLREAMLFMYQKSWIYFDDKIDQYVLNKSTKTAFKESIFTNDFHQVTSLRIKEFKNIIPDWAKVFIDMGACLGTSFNKQFCIESIYSQISKIDYLDFITSARKLGILRNSDFDLNIVQFDHDLIRTYLLLDIGESKQRELASTLYDHLSSKIEDDKLKAFLAYQAGKPKEVEIYAEKYGDFCKKNEVFEDALEAYKIALFVIDENAATKFREANKSQWFIDDALNMAIPLVLKEITRSQRNKKILHFFIKIIEVINFIGSAGQEVLKQFITEGMIIAHEERDMRSIAIFQIRYGVHLFEKKQVRESIKQFQKALSILPVSDTEIRCHALLELAISQRHIGNKKQSFGTLKLILKMLESNDCEMKVRVYANAGSLYFHDDWNFVRRYWERALKLAKDCSSVNLSVHMMIDLAHLDLIEENIEKATICYKNAQEVAEKSGLKSQLFRIYLHLSIIYLLSNDEIKINCVLAERYLMQAESLGLMYSIDRKLWRVYANLANVHEVNANINITSVKKTNNYYEKTYIYDMYVIQAVSEIIVSQKDIFKKDLINDRRIIPALTNIYMRNQEDSYPKIDFKQLIPDFVIEKVSIISGLIMSKEFENVPVLMRKFLKKINGKYRFIFT